MPRINPSADQIPTRKRQGLMEDEPDWVPGLRWTNVRGLWPQDVRQKARRKVACGDEKHWSWWRRRPWVPLDSTALLQEKDCVNRTPCRQNAYLPMEHT